MRSLRRITILALVAAVCSMGAAGCRSGGKAKSDEHPTAEHSKEGQPKDHPKGEHPKH